MNGVSIIFMILETKTLVGISHSCLHGVTPLLFSIFLRMYSKLSIHHGSHFDVRNNCDYNGGDIHVKKITVVGW